MTAVVLDASALLALLLEEPGADVVRAAIDGAALSMVNFAEIVSHYASWALREAIYSRCSTLCRSASWPPTSNFRPTPAYCVPSP